MARSARKSSRPATPSRRKSAERGTEVLDVSSDIEVQKHASRELSDQELLIILKKLECARDLARCSSVSKQWSRVIQQVKDYFISRVTRVGIAISCFPSKVALCFALSSQFERVIHSSRNQRVSFPPPCLSCSERPSLLPVLSHW